ncbi:MAG: hypothetical protein QNJ81_10005 [Acidimicrobiia bacterium]|nr:hypothetical protein [Acidimicrobiia bacterium]
MKRIVAIVVLGMVMAACSGDSGTTTTSPAATTSTTEAQGTTTAPPPETVAPTTTAAPTTVTTAAPTTTAAPDTTPPELVVTYPAEWETVPDAEVVFTGTVEPGVQGVWSPPDYEAAVDAAGNWEVTISLSSGANEIVFFTLDQAANETVVERHVTYTAPMPCEGFAVVAEHVSAYPLGPTDWCGGWGYIWWADAEEIIFDLAQVTLNVPGDESQGWSIINNNPMLRYLPTGDDIEIRACPPAPGETWPGICGSLWVGPEPWQFHLWDIDDLNGFVSTGPGTELWRVLIDPATGEVVWVEQWWQP